MKANFLLLPLLPLALLCGCATVPFVVNDSQLNRIQISYRPADKAGKPCRISLIGAGYIEFIEGSSPRVTSDFAIDTENAAWNDVYQERLGVPPDVIRGWLQIFADAGLMDKSRRGRSTRPQPEAPARESAVFYADINAQKTLFVTEDEALLAPVRDLIAIIKQKEPGR